jgi:hypothetical protein
MATRTILSNDRKQRLIISTINTHLAIFHECGMEYKTQKKRKKIFQIFNPTTWGGGYEWIDSNSVLQPNIKTFSFFMGNRSPRNPFDFNLTKTTNVGFYKNSAVSINVSNPPANDVSWITDVTLSFDYENDTFNI